jgi:predicted nuclease of predicted toxin-antitoxin system
MAWARHYGYVVFTHDLDFGAILAATHARSPSVIQARTRDVMPAQLGQLFIRTIEIYERELSSGAIVTIDAANSKVRLLPL